MIAVKYEIDYALIRTPFSLMYPSSMKQVKSDPLAGNELLL